MKRRATAFLTTMLMVFGTFSPWLDYGSITAEATEKTKSTTSKETDNAETDTDVQETNLDFMSVDEYKSLGFAGLGDSSKYVDDSYDPLEGYQPQILNELYIGHLNHPDDYQGYFATAENLSSIYKNNSTEIDTDALNLDNMQKANVGGKQAYYDYDAMQTQCINVIGVVPGDLTREGAEIGEEILIESRLYQDTDGKDSSHHRVQAYARINSKWTGGKAIVTDLDSNSDWVGSITIREQGGFNALASGDYDQDGYNEVAVFNPTSLNNGGCIYFYQPKSNSDGTYDLVSDGEYQIQNLDVSTANRFNWGDGKTRPMVSMTTTNMAGHDSLVVSVTMPYDTHTKACNDGAVAVIEHGKDGYKTEWVDSLVIENESSRFKLQNVLDVDLNYDGKNEVLIAGHINTNYKNGKSRGDIDDDNMYVNVLVYEEGTGYYLAWQDSEVKKVPRHPDLHVDDSSKSGTSENDPITLSAGKYETGQLVDTIFCEGVFLHFSPDTTVNDPIERIRKGSFEHKKSEDLEFSNTDEAFVGQVATGCFSETERTIEQTVVIHGHNALGDDTCDVNYTWFYGTKDEGGKSTIAQVKYDDYINDADEDDNGTCVVLATVNVDDDSCYMKHVERCYGYSNPGVLGVILSPPYWEELVYGNDATSAGTASMTISYATGSSQTHEGNVGFDLHTAVGLYFNVGSSSLEGGLDMNFAANYIHSKTKGTSLSNTKKFTAGPGEDKVVLSVVPIVSDYYAVKHLGDESEEQLVVVNTTYEPSFTSATIESYNQVAEAFNEKQSEDEALLTIIDLDEVYYEGYTAGDPSTYPSSSEEILTIPKDDDGNEIKRESDRVSVTLENGPGLEIATETDYTKTNGVSFSLGYGVSRNYEFGIGIASLGGGAYVSVSGDINGGYSYTYATTESESYSYDVDMCVLPASAQTGIDSNGLPSSDYAYSVKMIQWDHTQNVILESETGEVVSEAIPYVGYLATTQRVPPRKVTDLKVAQTTKHSAKLEWTKPTDRIDASGNVKKIVSVDSYKLYMSDSLNGEYEVVQEEGKDVVIDGNQTSYTVGNLESDTTYYFKLQSFSENSTYSALSDAAKGTTLAVGLPIITEHPASMTRILAPGNTWGNGFEFKVGARSYHEDSTLEYQWQELESGEWKDVAGETGTSYKSSNTYPEDDGRTVRCVVTEVHADGTRVSLTSASAVLSIIKNEEITESKEQTKITLMFYPEKSGDDMSPDYKSGDCYQAAGETVDMCALLRTMKGHSMNDISSLVYTGKLYLFDLETGKAVKGYPVDIAYEGYGNVEVKLNDLPEGIYYVYTTFDGNENYHACTSGTSIIYMTEKTQINYELNGGENNDSNPTWFNKHWSNPLKFYDPVKENAIFEGWYLDNKFTEKVTYSSTYGVDILWPSEIESDSLTLYAKWTENEEYTINYELNGGENAEDNPIVIKKGETIGLKDPTKTGYTFDGWYLDAEFTQPCTTVDGNTGTDITVYAKWGEPVEYQIQYVLNGGTNAKENPSFYTIASDEITFKDPVWEGYEFEGWYTSMDYTTKVTGIPTGSTGTVVVYAKWTKTTTLDDEDGDGAYEISSYDDLVEMAQMIQYDPDTYATASYKQTNAINCMLASWTQEIGTKENPFEGTYDGNDYYITGLRPISSVMGLFGVIGEKGVVKNTWVVDFDYSEPALMASGLVGINYGVLDGCGSGVNLTSGGTTYLYGGTELVPVSALDSDIKGTVTAGGIVAVNEGTIKNSRSSAKVSITEEKEGSVAGGIAGENTGVICNIYNTGEISGAESSGGIAGENTGSIQYGYANGDVAGTTAGAVVGASENTKVSDFYYPDTMVAACGNKKDSELTNITPMALTEMASSTLKDALNTAIEGKELAGWTQKSTKNAGYPRLESQVAVKRTIKSSNGRASITGRIHPDAKFVVTRLKDGEKEYLSLLEWLKKDGIKEGWKLELVYEDGTMAVWEGDLTVKIQPENLDAIKELALLYYDINGEHTFPNVKVEGDTLIINVDDMGSFALTESSDVEKPKEDSKPSDDSKENNNDKDNNSSLKDKNDSNHAKTGDTASIELYVILLVASAIVVLSLIMWQEKKRSKR